MVPRQRRVSWSLLMSGSNLGEQRERCEAAWREQLKDGGSLGWTGAVELMVWI